MQEFDGMLQEIVRTIVSSVLGLEVEEVPAVAHERADGGTLAGVVQISGPWEGAVALQTSVAFARRAAVMMLGVEPEHVTMSDMQDALGELSNMAGGNFKGLLPGPCALSLPVVIGGSDFRLRLPGGVPSLAVTFQCEGETIVLTVFHRALAESNITV